MIPIFIAEETNDLLASIILTLRSMFRAEDVDEEIVRALLKAKHLLIIADAVSERSAATRKVLVNVFGSELEINAYFLSSRTELDFGAVEQWSSGAVEQWSSGAVEQISIYPQRINSRLLIPFIIRVS